MKITLALIAFVALPAVAQTAPQSMITPQARSAAELPLPEPMPPQNDAALAMPDAAGGVVTCLLAPVRVANIASPISGLVQKVAFQRADIVQAGDLLVQLDDRMAASDLELARITRKGLADRLERAQKLEATKIISRDEIESLRTEVATATAQVARADLQLQMTRITAPFSGVVANVLVEQGEVVGAAEIMQLIDISTLKVEISFGRAAFGTLKVGQSLNIVVDLVSKTVPAKILGVDPFLDASSNTFSVVALVDNADFSLPAGANCSLAP